MNIPDKREAFGEVTPQFENAFFRFLSQENKRIPRKRPALAIIATVLILGIACTALAIGNHYGIIDLLPWVQKEIIEYDDLFTARIEHKMSKDPDSLSVEVLEGYYDGNRVYISVKAIPKRNGTALIWLAETQNKNQLEVARKYGDTLLGISMSAVFPTIDQDQLGFSVSREGSGLVFVLSAMLPDGLSPDSIGIEALIDIYSEGGGAPIESATLEMQICKTTQPFATRFNVDFTNDLVAIDSISIEHTPLEMRITYEYTPLLATYSGLYYVNPDGTLNRATLGSSVEENGQNTFAGYLSLPLSGSLPETITLWIAYSDDILILDTQKNTVSAQKVNVTLDSMDNVRIEMR